MIGFTQNTFMDISNIVISDTTINGNGNGTMNGLLVGGSSSSRLTIWNVDITADI